MTKETRVHVAIGIVLGLGGPLVALNMFLREYGWASFVLVISVAALVAASRVLVLAREADERDRRSRPRG